MVKNKVRNVIKKKQKIEEFKKELKLNEEKLKGVTDETNAKLALMELEREDMQLKVDEIELVIELGLETIKPRFKYETYPKWLEHTEKSAKHSLNRANKRLANLNQSIEEGKK